MPALYSVLALPLTLDMYQDEGLYVCDFDLDGERRIVCGDTPDEMLAHLYELLRYEVLSSLAEHTCASTS